jgi:hypothetical protein
MKTQTRNHPVDGLAEKWTGELSEIELSSVSAGMTNNKQIISQKAAERTDALIRS